MGKQHGDDIDVNGKPLHLYGSISSLLTNQNKLYFMTLMAFFTIYGVGKMILPSNIDDDVWSSKGDAAGGWGSEHNHAIVSLERSVRGGETESQGSSAESSSLSLPTSSLHPPAVGSYETVGKMDHSTADDEIREADFLMVIAPIVFIPDHRPEYENYQDTGGSIEPEMLLYDKKTPHGMAFDFILNRDKRRVSADDPHLIQRFVLTLLFYATGGGDDNDPEEYSWTSRGRTNGWDSGAVHFLTGLHECHWVKKSLEDQFWGMISSSGKDDRKMGVTKCNVDMEVTEIRLADLGLSGFIPSEIKWLNNLISLDLQNNHLAGPIPTSLGELDDLEYLSLDGNNFSGPIPDVFYGLSNLDKVYLNFNEFNGPMPPSLCTLREDGTLTDLWSDCGGYPITCTCCTVCCDMVSDCDEMESQKAT